MFTFPGDAPKTDHFRVVTAGVTFQRVKSTGTDPRTGISTYPLCRSVVKRWFFLVGGLLPLHVRLCAEPPNCDCVRFEDAVGDSAEQHTQVPPWRGYVPPNHLVPFVQVHPETADAPLFLALLWVCPLTTETHDAVLCAHPLLIHTNADVVMGNEALCDVRGHKLDVEALAAQLARTDTSLSDGILRFDGGLNVVADEFQTQLCPTCAGSLHAWQLRTDHISGELDIMTVTSARSVHGSCLMHRTGPRDQAPECWTTCSTRPRTTLLEGKLSMSTRSLLTFCYEQCPRRSSKCTCTLEVLFLWVSS